MITTYAICTLAAQAAFGLPQDDSLTQSEGPVRTEHSSSSRSEVSRGCVILSACPDETFTDCVWDAKTMGNGRGRSFYSINGKTYYVAQSEMDEWTEAAN